MSNRFLFNALNSGMADEAQQQNAAAWIQRLSGTIVEREKRIRQLETELAGIREEELKHGEQPDVPIKIDKSTPKTSDDLMGEIFKSFKFWGK